MTDENPRPEAEKTASTPFDQTYKESFSDPEMVANLLRGYVPKKLVRFFDLSTLEEFPTDKIGAFGEEYRNDKLWKCRYRNRDSYILIMLEFQSANDKFMALRIRAYIDGIWNYLARHGLLKQGEFPLFLPIVLYNGQYRWTAPQTIDELLGDIPESLRPFQHGKYQLIDVGRLPQQTIDADKSPLSALMNLKRAETWDETQKVAKLLNLLFLDQETRKYAVRWIHYMSELTKRNPHYAKLDFSLLAGGNETMLEANLNRIAEDLIDKGRKEARAEAAKQISAANKEREAANKKAETASKRAETANKKAETANRKAETASKLATEARNNIVTGIKNLLALGTLPLEQIAQAFNMSIEQVMQIKTDTVCKQMPSI